MSAIVEQAMKDRSLRSDILGYGCVDLVPTALLVDAGFYVAAVDFAPQIAEAVYNESSPIDRSIYRPCL